MVEPSLDEPEMGRRASSQAGLRVGMVKPRAVWSVAGRHGSSQLKLRRGNKRPGFTKSDADRSGSRREKPKIADCGSDREEDRTSGTKPEIRKSDVRVGEPKR